MAGCNHKAAQAHDKTVCFESMMIPDDVTDERMSDEARPRIVCAVMPLSSDGNQARGGRWGSSGMNRVFSNGTRAASIAGAAGVPAIRAGAAADTTWWQQEWPLADSAGSLLPW